jgi:chromosome segregation ATPase
MDHALLLSAALDSARSTISAQQETIASLRAEIEAVRKALDDYPDDDELPAQAVERLLRAYDDSQARMVSVGEENMKQRGKVERLTMETSRQRVDHELDVKRMAELRAENDRLRAELERLKAEREQIEERGETAPLFEQIGALHEQVERLTAERDELAAAVREVARILDLYLDGERDSLVVAARFAACRAYRAVVTPPERAE